MKMKDQEVKGKPTFVLVTSHFFPHVGGVEQYSYHFARELVRRNHTVFIVTSRLESEHFFSVEEGVRVYRLRSYFIDGVRFPIPYSIREVYVLYKDIFTRKQLICIIQTRLFITSFLGAILCVLTRKRPIVIDHGSGRLVYKNWLMTWMFHIYEHVVTFFIKSSRPYWAGVSLESCRWLGHFLIDTRWVISNGVDRALLKKNTIEVPSYLPKDKHIVLYAGRLIDGKGILELIDGFIVFTKKRRDYVLLIAGAGDYESRVRMKIQNQRNIIYLGRLEHDKIIELIRLVHVVINPSSSEGMSTTMLEAGALQTPILTTIHGLKGSIIDDQDVGFTIQKISVEGIADSLAHFFSNKNEYKDFSQRIYNRINENYTWEKIVERFLSDISCKSDL